MRPGLRTWTLLLIGAILFVAGLFWVRAQRGAEKKDPVMQAQEGIEQSFGMRLATTSGPEGGLKVESVKPGSPADRAGVKVGDRAVAIGDRSVWHTYQFAQLVGEYLSAGPALPVLFEQKGDYRSVLFGRSGAMAGMPPTPAPPGH